MTRAAGDDAPMRVGDLAARLGVRSSTVRYWEAEGLLPPPRRAPNGYRTYSAHDLGRAERVRALRAVGLPTADIREIVQACDGRLDPCRHTGARLQRHADQLTERMDDLERVREALVALNRAFRS